MLGFGFAEAVTLTGLGEVCQALGRPAEATAHLDRALPLHREVGNRGGEAETLRVQATVERDAGRHERARELAETALGLARAAGDRRYEADALNTLGTIRYALGDRAGALRLLRETIDERSGWVIYLAVDPRLQPLARA